MSEYAAALFGIARHRAERRKQLAAPAGLGATRIVASALRQFRRIDHQVKHALLGVEHDAVAGSLAALVPAAEWSRREPATLPAAQSIANGHDVGRELFAGMRRNALAAEEGACTWL